MVQNINSKLYIIYGHLHFKGKEFASGKNVLAKLCNGTKKLTLSAE